MTASRDRRGSVAGLVLAAGRGERFGEATKQLALHDGRPLVVHVLDAARAAGLTPLVVVVGHDAARIRSAIGSAAATSPPLDSARVGHRGMLVRKDAVAVDDVDDVVDDLEVPDDLVVVDVGAELPQSASLRAGLAAVVDDPAVDAVAVLLADEPGIDPDVVATVIEKWRQGTDDVVRAVYADRPGHPFVAARAAWSMLMAVDGDAGARRADVEPRAVRIDANAPVDVDTPSDLSAVTTTDAGNDHSPGTEPSRSTASERARRSHWTE